MKTRIELMLLITAGMMGISGIAVAAGAGNISILSPKDGAMVKMGSAPKLTYKVMLSPEGNHLHVYVDDQKPIVDRDVSGCPCTVDLPALSAGKHTIVVKEARADHSLTGVEAKTIVTAD